jgi:chitinase
LSPRFLLTPMIGRNDVLTEVFHLTDAAELATFAAANDVGMLSMWSVNRDHPCPSNLGVSLTCSSDPQQSTDWAFMAAFSAYP